MAVTSAKELTAYQEAFALAMRIFELTKEFPDHERYGLVSPIRRSSPSICLNLREAWAKRRYRDHFVSKLTDCDGENGETDSALDFALYCGFITPTFHRELTEKCASIGRMLGAMIRNLTPFHLPRKQS